MTIQTKKLLLMTSIIMMLCIGLTSPLAFADDHTTETNNTSIVDVVITGGAFVIASMGYAVLGWQRRKRIEGQPFNYRKFGKSMLSGAILGTIVAGYLLVTDTSLNIQHITTFEGFVDLVKWAFPITVTTIVIVKKLFPDFVGRLQKNIEPKERTSPGVTNREKL